MKTKPMKVGIIGCGKISDAYFNGAKNAANFVVKACSDLNLELAKSKAEQHQVLAMSVDEILADPEIELIINLTIPAAHVPVGKQCLNAGKHVYAEKPLAVDLQEAKELLDLAQTKNLRVGSAPDTFLFKAGQTAIKAIDEGAIGTPTSGTAFMRSFGPEGWHPNPFFYYQNGGGPLLDMGPYYLTALVSILGPIRSVTGKSSRALNERIAQAENVKGQTIKVSTDTHFTGFVEFESGAIVTLIMSFDIHAAPEENLTLNGTKSSILIGDPNNFDKEPSLFNPKSGEWETLPFTHADNKRAYGVVDMVDAIQNNRQHRASGNLAYHVLETMIAFYQSSKMGQTIEIKSSVERPQPLPAGLSAWQI